MDNNYVKLTLQEASLHNLSKKNYHRWKKIQSFITFLSLLRKTLRDCRNFGVASHKREISYVVPGSKKPRKCYLLYPDSPILKFHSLLLMIIVVYLVIFLPIDLAFAIFDSSPMWGIAD